MMNMLHSKIKEMETEFDLTEHLVIELGNAYTKIGFSGEDLPKEIIPSLTNYLQITQKISPEHFDLINSTCVL